MKVPNVVCLAATAAGLPRQALVFNLDVQYVVQVFKFRVDGEYSTMYSLYFLGKCMDRGMYTSAGPLCCIKFRA